jgi:hypothetical protein
MISYHICPIVLRRLISFYTLGFIHPVHKNVFVHGGVNFIVVAISNVITRHLDDHLIDMAQYGFVISFTYNVFVCKMTFPFR